MQVIRIIAALLLFVQSSLPAVAQNFTEFLRLSSAKWGDFDRDGYLDLLSADLQIYHNNQGLIFKPIPLQAPSMGRTAFAWGDYDRDGDLDFYLTGDLAGKDLFDGVYRNDGTESFSKSTSLAAAADASVAWVDLDGDGDLDLFISGERRDSAGRPYWASDAFENQGAAGFNRRSFQIVGDVSWADFDADGNPDFALHGFQPSMALPLAIYRNQGFSSPYFVQLNYKLVTNLLDSFTGSASWGDYDNDNDLDLLVVGSASVAGQQVLIAKVFRTDATNKFVDIGASLQPVPASTGAWLDFDADGYLDIVISGLDPSSPTSPTTRFYRNDRNGGFTSSGTPAPLPGYYSPRIAVADFDNDGDMDLMIGNVLYRNNATSKNSQPSAPSGLTATSGANFAVLSWFPSSDLNQSNGHSYNVRLGSGAGRADIVSPMAILSNGFRLLPEFGNAGQRTQYKIKNIAPGVYYWSVQAIDNSFAGSAFAPEQKLVVGLPYFLSSVARSNGTVELNLGGVAGTTYALQSSTNLRDWSFERYVTMTNSVVSIIESNIASRVGNFYRASQ